MRLPTVPERLAALGDIYAQRNKLYGDNYKKFGAIMKVMFPNGITLTTEVDFNRFALFVHIMTKDTRYAETFMEGGHEDSLDDIAVYAQMLREVDAEAREPRRTRRKSPAEMPPVTIEEEAPLSAPPFVSDIPTVHLPKEGWPNRGIGQNGKSDDPAVSFSEMVDRQWPVGKEE